VTAATNPAPVLVVNAGSSSLKYQLVDTTTESALAKGSIERIGERSSEARHETLDGSGGKRHPLKKSGPIATHRDALAWVRAAFRDAGPDLDRVGLLAVGHRVVHGGDRFSDPVVVTVSTENLAPRAAIAVKTLSGPSARSSTRRGPSQSAPPMTAVRAKRPSDGRDGDTRHAGIEKTLRTSGRGKMFAHVQSLA